jgi:AcrR family transcriptional regulator
MYVMEAGQKTRVPLSRERVLRTAVALADERGIEALTMRNLGQELGVEAMSLYNHVSNKDDVFDGLIEVVVDEILAVVDDLPPLEDWKATLRRRILAAREVFLQHRWAPGVLETREDMPPGLMRYYDGVLGIMLAGGVSMDLAHHAMHALGSRSLGFTQELFTDDADVSPQEMAMMATQMAAYPNLVALMKVVLHEPDSTLGGCDDQFEFEFGLDLILDGLDRLRAAE